MKYILVVILTSLISCSPNEIGLQESSQVILGTVKAEAFESLLASFDNFINTNYSNQITVKAKYRQFVVDFNDFLDLSSKNKSESRPDPGEKWKINKRVMIDVHEKMESSRMRHEIMLFPYETYKANKKFLVVPNKKEKLLDTAETKFLDDDLLEEEFLKEEEIIKMEPNFDKLSEEELEIRRAKKHAEFEAAMDSSMFFNDKGIFLYYLRETYPKDTLVWQYIDGKLLWPNISLYVTIDGYKNLIDNDEVQNLSSLRTLLTVDLYYQLVILNSKI